MATALQSALKLTPNEFVDTVRESAIRLVETAQATFEQKQKEGRLALSKQVLIGAHRVNDLSKALVELSAKIAPAAPKARATAKAKPAARRKPAAKPAVKRTATRARKAA
ncbi:MAG: hypothetical protein JO002_04305 [Burkholderiaceae bacterium]|nr:hypothetical protein [Burkholderiaceae bacterium]